MRRDYDFGTQLGRGSFGVVFKVKRKADGLSYVCKQIQLQSMNKKAREEANQEVTLLRKVSSGSAYIVQYVESFLDGDSLHIIMEFCEHGDLGKYLKAQMGQNLPEATVWKFIVQIALGLRWLHLNRILHRDIKTLNVFLTSANDVRLGDLGVARVLSHNTNFASTFVGTPYYLSPELCEEKPYNEKSDVWAFGCVVYEMCALKHPFEARNHAALLIKILRGQYSPVPREYSLEMRDLIDECMRSDYTRRPTLTELLDGRSAMDWAERLSISLAPGSSATDVAEQPAARARPAARTAALPPRRVPLPGQKAALPSRTAAVGGAGGPGLIPARRSAEPTGARCRGGVAKGRGRVVQEAPVQTQVISAPPSALAAAQQVANRAPVARGAGRAHPPPAPVSAAPVVGAARRMDRVDAAAEERRRAAAAREVASLPDFFVPHNAGRRNVPSVQELMQMEATGSSGFSERPCGERPFSAASDNSVNSEARGFLQQAVSLGEADPLEVTAMPAQHAQAEEEMLEEATLLARPLRAPDRPGLPRPPVYTPSLPQAQTADEQFDPIAPVSLNSSGEVPMYPQLRLLRAVEGGDDHPQLRLLRAMEGGDDPLACSVFDSTLADDWRQDSLAFTATELLHPYDAADSTEEDEYPNDVSVRWNVADPTSGAVDGPVEDYYDDDDFEEVEDVEDLDDHLQLTAKLNSEGLLCDPVVTWAVTEAPMNSGASGEAPLQELASPAVVDPVEVAEAAELSRSSKQCAQLAKNVRHLSAQITREYNNIVKDMDVSARAVWDELYELFKAKMSAELTDEDQSEIERFVFESLPTESTDLIWKVYKVLHLEQERDRCQKLLAEKLDTS